MTDSNKVFDGLLVLQYRSGNKKALSVLVKKYHSKLCRHSYWYTHDIDTSKDIVQDCWSIIINKLDSLKNPNLFGSWAFRIVTRKSLDFVSQKKREQAVLNNYQYVKTTYENADNKKVELYKLQEAIYNLTKDQQIVLRLFYIENYKLNEIGEILNISVGTIKSRLFHAREKLKKILKK